VSQPVAEGEGKWESVQELLLPPETPLCFETLVWGWFSALAMGCSEEEYLLDRGWKAVRGSVPN
jgi:hypothetical protein